MPDARVKEKDQVSTVGKHLQETREKKRGRARGKGRGRGEEAEE